MLERVQYRLRQTHIGFKMLHTARTYNITVNQRRQILATTAGHPALWNDKTLAIFDNFMTDLKDGHIINDMFFSLYEDAIGGNTTKKTTVVTRTYQGAWLLVDNGYLAWPTTVPPIAVDLVMVSAWTAFSCSGVRVSLVRLSGKTTP
jgi:hypothetical protein